MAGRISYALMDGRASRPKSGHPLRGIRVLAAGAGLIPRLVCRRGSLGPPFQGLEAVKVLVGHCGFHAKKLERRLPGRLGAGRIRRS